MTTAVTPTPIPGLLVVGIDLHVDGRGWFRETWQRERMVASGLPDFAPVQHNVSFNHRRGTTRGFHAEPWDKLVAVASGRAFGAWVDLREGPGFGTTFTIPLEPSVAVFVPRGVGNAYQTLEADTAYSYLVNAHWSPEASYTAMDLADPVVAIRWPVPLSCAEMSEKDRRNPQLADVTPVPPRRTLVLGADGQVGRALTRAFPWARAVGRAELDVTDARSLDAVAWGDYDVVLNATAFTAVDAAESEPCRTTAWQVNAAAPAQLARLAREHRFTLVHYSTDYVFDGTRDEHAEDEPLSPLGAYGQSKAAGDLAVSTAPAHYLLRTSWVVGDGPNFVRTMQGLAAGGACPSVVEDQVGRLTFADELARATRHLLESRAAYGTYNVSNAGPSMSWADVARAVYQHSGRSLHDVTGTSTAAYSVDRALAPRPRHSTLDLAKLRGTGFEPEDGRTALERYSRRAAASGP
ncbi:sugar nucleotide-binding protein [Nocardioides caricicola]|uniref:dTDP-4-dehydrorhamnose reductase n=1 Tax=Nocardioides caricicola TaxID=634770 RepID=A0ABW0MY68_9ACTN